LTYAWTQAGGDPVTGTGARALTVCPAVCYDLRFPELFRRGLLAGAGAFAIGANWPAARAAHWRALLVARAIENQAFVLGVNRTGSDPHLVYAGGSIALGPKGEVLGELGATPGVLTVEIDPLAVREWRDTFPAWKDARLSFSPRT
jgi:predicted amidohydrolase